MAEPDRSPPEPGPFLQTVSGRRVNPFDPDPSQLDVGDIARALGAAFKAAVAFARRYAEPDSRRG